MTTQAEALDRLIAAVEAGQFPDDITARQLGMTAEYGGLPIIKTMYAAFSGSLDAAKALHDALLPGMWFCISGPHSKIGGIYDGGPSRFDALLMRGEMQQADNPARAWLLAILRAYRGTLG